MAVICSDPTTGAHTRIAYLHACTDSKTKSRHEENNVAVSIMCVPDHLLLYLDHLWVWVNQVQQQADQDIVDLIFEHWLS